MFSYWIRRDMKLWRLQWTILIYYFSFRSFSCLFFSSVPPWEAPRSIEALDFCCGIRWPFAVCKVFFPVDDLMVLSSSFWRSYQKECIMSQISFAKTFFFLSAILCLLMFTKICLESVQFEFLRIVFGVMKTGKLLPWHLQQEHGKNGGLEGSDGVKKVWSTIAVKFLPETQRHCFW